MRFYHLIVFFAVLSLYSLAQYLSGQQTAPAVFLTRPKIGVSTALSGPAATFGTDVKNVVLFANHHLANDAYDVVLEDDQCVARQAVTAARHLVGLEGLQAVFGNCSATVIAAAPIYKSSGVLMFAPIASSPMVSTIGDNVFRTVPSDKTAAAMLYDFISKRHNRLGILTEESQYCEDFLAAFKERQAGAGLEIRSELFLSGQSDVRAILAKFMQQGIDAIFVNSNSEQSYATVIKQIKELRIPIQIYGALIPGSAKFLEIAGDSANGIVFVDFPQNQQSLTDEGRRLFQTFREEYGAPNSWEISFATTIEAFRAMHQALSQNGDRKEFLHHAKFNGVIGEYSFDSHGDIIGLKPAMRRIENVNFVTIE